MPFGVAIMFVIVVGTGMRGILAVHGRAFAVTDKIVGRLAPKAKASACIPNDPYYTCWNHAYMYCSNNCTGQEFCHQVGSC